jgi:hypothetical protein
LGTNPVSNAPVLTDDAWSGSGESLLEEAFASFTLFCAVAPFDLMPADICVFLFV